MLVYEIRLKVMLKKDLVYYEAGEIMGRLLNKVLCDERNILSFMRNQGIISFMSMTLLFPVKRIVFTRREKCIV